MRVLITSSIYPTPGAPNVVGGAEIFVKRFAESLASEGNQVEVIRAASRPNQQVESHNGVDVYSSPVHNIYPPFTPQRNAALRGIWHTIEDWEWKARLVRERILSFKPDVLHSNNLSGLTTAVWKASAKLDVPVVHTLHDYYLTCPRCSRFANGHACVNTCKSCQLLTLNRRSATRNLKGVVAVSQRILDIHKASGLFDDTKIIKVIRHASAIGPVPPLKNVSNGPLRLGFIGRLTEEKGIYNLAQAVAKLPPGKARLVIAGSASTEVQERLRALAPEARIDFLGFVAPEEFYQQIDIIVIPPIWEEPGPIVVADAQAAGRPFLGTRFGGIPEAVAKGAVGWLTAPDPDSLAESILDIMSKPEEVATMVRKLATNASQRTFSDVVTEYREVFEQTRRQE